MTTVKFRSKEFHALTDSIVNSDVYNRYNKEIRAKYAPDSDGDYPIEYWDEQNEMTIALLQEAIEHFRDVNRIFHDEKN